MINSGLLSTDQLATLLAGGGSAHTTAILQSSQRNRNLMLLRALIDMVERDVIEDGLRADFWNNFDALCMLEAAAPSQIAGLIGHPHFGAWIADCLRLITSREPARTCPLWVDLGYLGAFAVSAAAAAKVPVEASVPRRQGRIVIPRMGTILLSSSDLAWEMTKVQYHGDGTFTISQHDGLLTALYERPGRHSSWRGIRHLQASCDGLTVDLELDDTDPYRDCHNLGAVDHLSEEEFALWQRQFTRAWAVLATRHRETAEAIAAGLQTLVPLATRGSASGISATARYAAGAVSVTPQADPVRLARTLIHEFQHTKLNLLMDLTPIYVYGTYELFYSPWREDPRPLVGLIHGIYAGLGVANFWDIERAQANSVELSEFESARVKKQIAIGLTTLAGCNRLTSAGAALLEAIKIVVGSWDSHSVQTRPMILADDLVSDHQVRWRLRNLVPQDSEVRHIAASWHAQTAPPSVPPVTRLVTAHKEAFAEDARLRLAYQILTDAKSIGQSMKPSHSHGSAAADLWLIRGDYAEAAHAYEAEIIAGTPLIEPWAGLAISCQRLLSPKRSPLITRPELVRALYEHVAVSSKRLASPIEIAEWLTPMCGDASH